MIKKPDGQQQKAPLQAAGKGEDSGEMLPGQMDMFRKDRHRQPKIVGLPEPSEVQLQISLVTQLKLLARKEIEWWYTPNGEPRDKRQAAKEKAMGVRPGVSDLTFLFPETSEYPVLFLELKARGRGLTDAQKHFKARVQALGYAYEMADTIDEALRVCRKYRVFKQRG